MKEESEQNLGKKENNWKIYCHTNLVNGKKYVGQTKRSLKSRWLNKGRGYQNNELFWNDILKFDWNIGFKHEVLQTYLTADEADYWEKYYIKEWGLMNPEKGYNRKEGGKDGRYSQKSNRQNMLSQPNRKPVICLETKQVFESISQASREMNLDASMISKVCKGECAYAKQFHFKFLNEYNPKDKYNLIYTYERKIICLNDKKIYSNSVKCGEKYGINASSVREICRGIFKTIKGLSFCYLEDYDKDKEYDIKPNGRFTKPVICIETKKIYNSAKECSKDTGVSITSISRNCLNKTNSANGLHFCFLKDYNENKDYDLRCGNDFNAKSVICLDTGEIFKSISECARSKNVHYTLISAVCKGIQTHTHGLHFKYYKKENSAWDLKH